MIGGQEVVQDLDALGLPELRKIYTAISETLP
jgi:hypothetical protein